ncbi:hypothetical protein C1752_10380 [Acaryochloris thomasi RCC1774]|uniref:Uncharacterized protein n=1 Tax=Acaryochloris thomasi RCC1774 TaxID=1764569 RepID=A0A2W1J8C6_9CYAN|nr:hypothetical protein [Acaryochloris thomasi]PZD70659.1 hypothetical protein C1752_10380 [Acaryochloris thomasi RCC1774]
MLQLELDLQLQIETAEQDPEESSVSALLPSLDLIWELDELPPAQQLAIAGDVFLQISEYYGLRADVLLEGWHDSHSLEGPIYDIDDGLVRRYMDCDDGLVAEREPTTRRTFPKAEEFFAEVDDQEALLQELGVGDPLPEPEPEEVFAVIEEEDVGAWVDAIAKVLQAKDGLVLVQLKEKLELSIGRLWLGLLLGGFDLQQVGEFYSFDIMVK